MGKKEYQHAYAFVARHLEDVDVASVEEKKLLVCEATCRCCAHYAPNEYTTCPRQKKCVAQEGALFEYRHPRPLDRLIKTEGMLESVRTQWGAPPKGGR